MQLSSDKSFLKNMLSLVVMVVVIVYFVFSAINQGNNRAGVSADTSSTLLGPDFFLATKKINDLKLDDSVFKSKEFQYLRDLRVPLEQREVGNTRLFPAFNQ